MSLGKTTFLECFAESLSGFGQYSQLEGDYNTFDMIRTTFMECIVKPISEVIKVFFFDCTW